MQPPFRLPRMPKFITCIEHHLMHDTSNFSSCRSGPQKMSNNLYEQGGLPKKNEVPMECWNINFEHTNIKHIYDKAHKWRSGSIWDMNSFVLYSCLLHSLSKLSFQYNRPDSSHLLFAGHRKHILMAFQLERNCHKALWNSQSPRSSVTWNKWCPLVIGVPARAFSFSVRSRPPGRLDGLSPTYNAFSDHTIQRNMVLVVRFKYSSAVSQAHNINLEHRMLRGRNRGRLRKKHVSFSFLTLVTSCAASP